MGIKRIALCLFGVIPRSIKYTYGSIQNNIIDELSKYYYVDIIVFNLNTENDPVDTVILNQDDVKIISNINQYEEEYQTNVDKKIKAQYGEVNGPILKMRSDYPPIQIQNAARQMYSEYRVGQMLNQVKEKYATSIVCGPDYFILNPIDINHVKNTIENTNLIYTSKVNVGNGYTNGFYIGHPQPMIKLLSRYSVINKMFPTNKDYEYTVKYMIENERITHNVTGIVFFKVRANKYISRQGIMISKYFDMNYDNLNSLLNI